MRGAGARAPVGGGSAIADLAGKLKKLDVIGAFESGTPYVPKTGLALVHQGERIVPARENRDDGVAQGRAVNVSNYFTIQGGVDRRTQEQIAVASGRSVQRALGRST
jgi:hypothetical protein